MTAPELFSTKLSGVIKVAASPLTTSVLTPH